MKSSHIPAFSLDVKWNVQYISNLLLGKLWAGRRNKNKGRGERRDGSPKTNQKTMYQVLAFLLFLHSVVVASYTTTPFPAPSLGAIILLLFVYLCTKRCNTKDEEGETLEARRRGARIVFPSSDRVSSQRNKTRKRLSWLGFNMCSCENKCLKAQVHTWTSFAPHYSSHTLTPDLPHPCDFSAPCCKMKWSKRCILDFDTFPGIFG